jgi:hypothetical protein
VYNQLHGNPSYASTRLTLDELATVRDKPFLTPAFFGSAMHRDVARAVSPTLTYIGSGSHYVDFEDPTFV